MPKGNRSRGDKAGLAFAIIIALLLGSLIWWQASAEETRAHVEAQDRAADEANAAGIGVIAKCVVAELSEEDCAAEAEREARPDQRDEYDLEAQRTMAAWTRAMGIAALIGMGVGIAGLGLIYTTFRETRRQAQIAQQNLQAFYESERAILRVVSAAHGTVSGNGHSGNQSVIALVFRNIGRTSTRITFFGGKVYGGAQRWADVPAGGEGIVTGPAVPDDINAVLDGWFWIEYSLIGGGTGTANFKIIAEWFPEDGWQPGRWVCEVTNNNGHPDDT